MPPRFAPRRRRRRPRPLAAAGFTLLELIIVIAIIGILATIVMPQLKDKPRRAKEAVLKTNLFTIRDNLDQYHADHGKYPASLEALVEGKYLRKVPMDPITNRTDTWVLIYEEATEDGSEPVGEEEGGPGVIDVKSGAPGKSLSGTPYSEW